MSRSPRHKSIALGIVLLLLLSETLLEAGPTSEYRSETVLARHEALAGACLGDVDGSGFVDGFDLAQVGRAFASIVGQPHYSAAADLNQDAQVDGDDLAFVAAALGQTCPLSTP